MFPKNDTLALHQFAPPLVKSWLHDCRTGIVTVRFSDRIAKCSGVARDGGTRGGISPLFGATIGEDQQKKKVIAVKVVSFQKYVNSKAKRKKKAFSAKFKIGWFSVQMRTEKDLHHKSVEIWCHPKMVTLGADPP